MIKSAKDAKKIISKNCPLCDDSRDVNCDCYSKLRLCAESYLSALRGPDIKPLVEAALMAHKALADTKYSGAVIYAELEIALAGYREATRE